MKHIYTLGYGGRKWEEFLSLVREHGVKMVIDVRAFPKSKYPEYSAQSMEENLRRAGIGYARIPELGGYRRGGYQAYTRTEEFKKGVKMLEELAGKQTSVVVCLERDPKGCHRRFIADELARRGWKILHILKKGEVIEHAALR